MKRTKYWTRSTIAFEIRSKSTASTLQWVAVLKAPSLHHLLHCGTALLVTWGAVCWWCNDREIGKISSLTIHSYFTAAPIYRLFSTTTQRNLLQVQLKRLNSLYRNGDLCTTCYNGTVSAYKLTFTHSSVFMPIPNNTSWTTLKCLCLFNIWKVDTQ